MPTTTPKRTMDRDELLRDWLRFQPTERGTRVLVRTIRWDGPHTPVSDWRLWRQFGTEEGLDRDEVSGEVLDDVRFFGSCRTCGERKPRGWMHGEGLCQACAERDHGVVY